MDNKQARFESAEIRSELDRVTNNPKICPYCGGTDFTLSNEFGIIHKSAVWGKVDLKDVSPVVMLVCDKCGNVALFTIRLKQ